MELTNFNYSGAQKYSPALQPRRISLKNHSDIKETVKVEVPQNYKHYFNQSVQKCSISRRRLFDGAHA